MSIKPPSKRAGVGAWLEWHRLRQGGKRPRTLSPDSEAVWIRSSNRIIQLGDLCIVILPAGAIAVFDSVDLPLVGKHNWRIEAKSGKSYVTTGARHTQMGRVILGLSGLLPDHINGCGMDNRRANLRSATQQQNTAYRRKQSKPSSSRYKGVGWHKKDKRWHARIGTEGKTLSLGSFRSEIEAARAYDAKARELWGDFALCNFPLEVTA